MGKIFKYVTLAVIGCLLISALLHLVLYVSDGEGYRRWITIQIVIQVSSAISLLFVLKRSLIALVVFALASVAFTFINANYTNYGHNHGMWNGVCLVLFWALYGYVLFKGWGIKSENSPRFT